MSHSAPTEPAPEGQYPDEAHDQPKAVAPPPSFLSLANLKVAQVNVITGLLNGYSIGFVGVYLNLYGSSQNCAAFFAEKGCTTVPNAKCYWDTNSTANPFCGWQSGTCSQLYTDIDSCSADSNCQWAFGSQSCTNKIGFTSSESGIFTGAMPLGNILGSFFAGNIVNRIGPKLSFFLVGIITAVSCVMWHVSTAIDSFWLIAVFRLVFGLAMGLVYVAAPMYTAQNSHPKYSKMNGVLFQIVGTLGIVLAAVVGLGVGQSVDFKANKDPNLMGRMQGICSLCTAFALLVAVMGLYLRGCGLRVERAVIPEDDADVGSDASHHGDEGVNGPKVTTCQKVGLLLVGVMVGATMQLTGLNAVMNYGPVIMGNFNLAPLVGNIILMAWSFVTAIAAIPLSTVCSMRQTFLVGSLVASVSCLFLCGVPVYPGVASTNVKNGVAITGTLLFLAAFGMGFGPSFYVLTQDLFPPSFRAFGSSFVMTVQAVFALIICVCYPIATEGLSGGPSGNQDKGQAIVFIFFGGVGLICFFVQLFFLKPFDDGSASLEAQGRVAATAEQQQELDDVLHKPDPEGEEVVQAWAPADQRG